MNLNLKICSKNLVYLINYVCSTMNDSLKGDEVCNQEATTPIYDNNLDIHTINYNTPMDKLNLTPNMQISNTANSSNISRDYESSEASSSKIPKCTKVSDTHSSSSENNELVIDLDPSHIKSKTPKNFKANSINTKIKTRALKQQKIKLKKQIYSRTNNLIANESDPKAISNFLKIDIVDFENFNKRFLTITKARRLINILELKYDLIDKVDPYIKIISECDTKKQNTIKYKIEILGNVRRKNFLFFTIPKLQEYISELSIFKSNFECIYSLLYVLIVKVYTSNEIKDKLVAAFFDKFKNTKDQISERNVMSVIKLLIETSNMQYIYHMIGYTPFYYKLSNIHKCSFMKYILMSDNDKVFAINVFFTYIRIADSKPTFSYEISNIIKIFIQVSSPGKLIFHDSIDEIFKYVDISKLGNSGIANLIDLYCSVHCESVNILMDQLIRKKNIFKLLTSARVKNMLTNNCCVNFLIKAFTRLLNNSLYCNGSILGQILYLDSIELTCKMIVTLFIRNLISFKILYILLSTNGLIKNLALIKYMYSINQYYSVLIACMLFRIEDSEYFELLYIFLNNEELLNNLQPENIQDIIESFFYSSDNLIQKHNSMDKFLFFNKYILEVFEFILSSKVDKSNIMLLFQFLENNQTFINNLTSMQLGRIINRFACETEYLVYFKRFLIISFDSYFLINVKISIIKELFIKKNVSNELKENILKNYKGIYMSNTIVNCANLLAIKKCFALNEYSTLVDSHLNYLNPLFGIVSNNVLERALC